MTWNIERTLCKFFVFVHNMEIFNWTFEVVNEFAETYNLNLDTFKKDANDRLYFVYTKR